MQLGLSVATLNIIEADNPKSVEACCNAVFAKWLEVASNPTWKVIFSIVESPDFLFYASKLLASQLAILAIAS